MTYFCLRRLPSTTPDQLVQHDHGHESDSDDEERWYRRPGQLLVRGELKRAGGQ